MAISYIGTLLAFGAVVSTALSVPTQLNSQIECTRAALIAAADAYVAAQTAGKLDALQTFLSKNWTYQENNKVVDSTAGVLVKSLKLDHRRTNIDTGLCASFTELIATDAANPYVIGTQIHHNTDDLKIQLIDSVASTTNSWAFNASKTLSYLVKEKWDPIPESKWDSRAVIQAAGNIYMDVWSNASAQAAIPFGTPCARLEGSAYTGKDSPTDSCAVGLPSNHSQKANINRRYVIDQSMGSVNILCLWQHMMNAADSHEFRLEGGKLRYVHTMTECGGKACKL